MTNGEHCGSKAGLVKLLRERPLQLDVVSLPCGKRFLVDGLPCFGTAKCRCKRRHRHQEEEVGRLRAQSAEVYIVEKLGLGAEKRSSGVERGGEGNFSRLLARRAVQVVRHRAARRQGAYRKLHKQRPGQPGRCGLRARRCAAAARMVARDPAARGSCSGQSAVQIQREERRDGQIFEMALAEELATLDGCEPACPLTEVTLLTVAGALDSAGCRSASSQIAELGLRHAELDFAISPALDRAFKMVHRRCYEGLRPCQESTQVEAFGHPAQHRLDDSRRGGRLCDFVALVAPGR